MFEQPGLVVDNECYRIKAIIEQQLQGRAKESLIVKRIISQIYNSSNWKNAKILVQIRSSDKNMEACTVKLCLPDIDVWNFTMNRDQTHTEQVADFSFKISPPICKNGFCYYII